MIRDYLRAAMEKAQYEIIDDPEPYYGEFPSVVASGPPVRRWKNAAETLRMRWTDGW